MNSVYSVSIRNTYQGGSKVDELVQKFFTYSLSHPLCIPFPPKSHINLCLLPYLIINFPLCLGPLLLGPHAACGYIVILGLTVLFRLVPGWPVGDVNRDPWHLLMGALRSTEEGLCRSLIARGFKKKKRHAGAVYRFCLLTEELNRKRIAHGPHIIFSGPMLGSLVNGNLFTIAWQLYPLAWLVSQHSSESVRVPFTPCLGVSMLVCSPPPPLASNNDFFEIQGHTIAVSQRECHVLFIKASTVSNGNKNSQRNR